MRPSASLTFRAWLALFVLSFFAHRSQAGHLHRHLRYRQLDNTGGAPAPADQLASDMADLQHSFSSFGTDLWSYLASMASRMSQVEKIIGMVQASTASSPSTAAPPTVLSTAPTFPPSTSVATAESDVIFSTPAPLTQLAPTSSSILAPSTSTFVSTSTVASSIRMTTSLSTVADLSTPIFPPSGTEATLNNGHKTSSTDVSPQVTSTTQSSTEKPSSHPFSPTPYATSLPTTQDQAAASSSPSPGPSSVATKDVFDPLSSSNLAVYYGQTVNTTATGLLELCQDPRINIVNLAFVPTFFADGSDYPSVEFGPACQPATAAQRAEAPGLLNCSALAPQIASCQADYSTKILVSMGGYAASSSFTSDMQARNFAYVMWNLFGSGTDLPALRPFGPDVVLDGFDVDNEDASTAHWPAFFAALKASFALDASRRFYVSAAPQCPRPDASIPEAILQHADFVWVQFYNNPQCDLDAGQGFVESVAAWSQDLALGGAAGTATGASPRLFIGMGAWPGAGAGFLDGAALPGVIAQARQAAGENFGGIMLWDGTVGEQDGYVAAAKTALA